MTRNTPRWSLVAVVATGLVVLVTVALWRQVREPWVPSREFAVGLGDGALEALRPPRFKCVLRGVVVDIGGRPIRGARVAVASRGGRPAVTHVSDPQGRVAIPVWRAATFRLMVTASGWARLVRLVVVSAPGELAVGRLPMAPEQTLSGQVRDPSGRPISDAEILAFSALTMPGQPAEPPHRAVTDRRGRFRLVGLLEGPYRVQVKAAGYGLVVRRIVDVPGLGLQLRLRTLRAITGQVTADGAPAVGATVTLVGSGVWPPIKTKTGALGQFRFAGIPEGIYELGAARGTWISPPAPAVDLVEGSGVPQVLLRLEQGTEVTGKVVDAQTRKPLQGVRITLGQDTLVMNPRLAQTGKDGVFKLVPVLPGEYRITLDRTDYLPRRAVSLTVVAGENPVAEYTLHRGGQLSGQVIDDTGRPVPSARIEVIGRARGSYIADRSGSSVALQQTLWDQALRSLAGRASAEATPLVPGSLGVMPGPIPLPPAVDSQGDLTGAAPLAPLSGRASAFMTDQKGEFSIPGIPPGNVSLIIRHGAFALAKAGPFRLRRGEVRTGLVIRMQPGTTLIGAVIDGIGKPVDGAQVAVANATDPFHLAVRSADEKGAFRVRNLRGRVRLRITAPGFVSRVLRLTVSGGATKDQRVVITLERALCAVRGRLLDSHRLPVSGARVTLTSITPDAPSRGIAVSDGAGMFEITGLGTMAYEAAVRHRDFPDHRFTVRCPDPAVRWKLAYGGGLAFEVRDRRTRDLLSSFRYVLERPGGPVIRRQSLAGRARLTSVPAGRYRLTVRSTRYAEHRQEVVIPGGRAPKQITRRDVVIWLDLGGSIEGFVRDDRGLAVVNALVKVGLLEERTDRKGRFVIRDVPPGTHEIVATHPDRGTGRLPGVDVRSGLPTVNQIIDLTPGSQAPEAVKAGVAMSLAVRGDRLVVARVTGSSDAERAGLAVGDELLTVDGQELDGLGLGDVEKLLQGPAGTRVVLGISRRSQALKLSVRRELLK